MARRKTICLVTNWYPTKENPFYGTFFKEQAFALEDYYDFVILHCIEQRTFFSSCRHQPKLVNEERNTKEYSLDIKNSFFYDVANQISDMKYRAKSDRDRMGIGKKLSSVYIRRKKKAIKRAMESEFPEFDALYCVDAQYEAGLIGIMSEVSGKPYVISEHSPVPPLGLLINNLNYEAIEKADLFLAISHDKIRQMLMQGLKLPSIFYIGNMIDEDKFACPDRSEHAVKRLLAVGANSFYKNYDLFCDIMEKLCRITDADFKIVIAGYAAGKGYAKNVEEFEKTLVSSSFSGRLELIPTVERDEIADVYASADAFVMTSLQEGQPLAALEAACCGLPIYSTRCGGVEDYVDEKMGRVYNVTDADGMAEGLKEFIEGNVMYDSEYIRNKVIALYGKEAFIRNFRAAFDGVIDGGSF